MDHLHLLRGEEEPLFLLPKSLLSSLNLAKVALALFSVSGWLVWLNGDEGLAALPGRLCGGDDYREPGRCHRVQPVATVTQ